MATAEELELRIKQLKNLATKDGSQELANAVTRAEALLQSFRQAVSANTPVDAERIAKEIIDLEQVASRIASQNLQATTSNWWPYVGMAVLGLVFFGLAWFFYHYVNEAGLGKLSTIEGTRPLLVIAAIISTIAFGGALLIGSLFSSEGSFEDRFRRSREIFLVFSGIFGTIMGFYFGAGESKGLALVVNAALEEASVVAHATAGAPPYKITLTYGPKTLTKSAETKTGFATFLFDKKKDNIIPLKILATDSKNLQGSFDLNVDKEDLKKAGWALPEETSITQPKPDTPKPPQPTTTESQSKPTKPSDQKNATAPNK